MHHEENAELHSQSWNPEEINLLNEIEQDIHIQEKYQDAIGYAFNMMQKSA
jgi:hypothetical protein